MTRFATMKDPISKPVIYVSSSQEDAATFKTHQAT